MVLDKKDLPSWQFERRRRRKKQELNMVLLLRVSQRNFSPIFVTPENAVFSGSVLAAGATSLSKSPVMMLPNGTRNEGNVWQCLVVYYLCITKL